MRMFTLLFVCATRICAQKSPVNVKIGALFPTLEQTLGKDANTVFSNSAGAITIALDRIFQEKLLPDGSNISFIIDFEECIPSTSMGLTFKLIDEDKVDAIFAPPCIDAQFRSQKMPVNIKIGALFPTDERTQTAYSNSAGAITVALNRIFEEKLLPDNSNITFIIDFEECIPNTAMGLTFKLIDDDKVDMIFAPPCIDGARVAGYIATFYNIPITLWGVSFDSEFSNSQVYPTMLSTVSNYRDMASVICALLGFYDWDTFSLIYQANSLGTCFSFQQDMEAPDYPGARLSGYIASYYNIPVTLWGPTFDSEFANTQVYPTMLAAVSNYRDMSNVICAMMQYYDWNLFSLIYQANEDGTCFSFQQDMEDVSNSQEDCLIAYKEPVDSWVEADIQFTIDNIKATSRIVVMCFDDPVQHRDFTLRLKDAGMDSPDYVYILADTDMLTADDQPFWYDRDSSNDGRDSDSRAIANRTFLLQIYIDTTSDVADAFTNFSDEVMARMSDWPFYCSNCSRGQQASPYATTLYDAMYLYGRALGNAINNTGSSSPTIYRNGTLISDSAQVEFEGMSGTVVIGKDGVRNAIYRMGEYNAKDEIVPYLQLAVTDDGINVSTFYSDPYTSVWASRSGEKPLSTPKCGFSGNGCTIDAFEQYKGIFIAAIIVGILVIIGILVGIYYIITLRIRDIEKQNLLWQISYNSLNKVTSKVSDSITKSSRSISSLPSSTSTKFTFDSVKSMKNFIIYIFRQERTFGVTHPVAPRLDSEDMAELRGMRTLEHENVNRFIGLSIDGPAVISVWKYCGRGSIQDIIGNNSLNKDGFFVYSLIRDVAEGLTFIHNSFLQFHGFLRSISCLIDDRWVVKISDYGLKSFRNKEKRAPKDLLWSSPENLREDNYIGNQQGDVYSFAIICSEIINMKYTWESTDEGNQTPEDIVAQVKRGGRKPFRPILDPVAQDLSPALLHLIKDCWNEDPSDRPKMEVVKNLLNSMNTGKSSNLMDHVFNMLEKYAASLEEEVEARTRELVEEKKKSDILLYRLLPKQVADKLKMGQSVEPESFETVTVFFSDVVSFTTLASRCTPLQVVNLLNDLYTMLDGIISEFDVYKVETIGDGYLCVSGLPHRNGNEHSRHIANMSLGFMKSLHRFAIPHLPGERISLRIGIHTGPCVAGVVGLSMPRFCLFGDTINIASRMESGGKPNKIQLSSTANHYLTKLIGGYVTQSRGEIIVKGKGVMETFWLLGLESDPTVQKEFIDSLTTEKPEKMEEI